ncbi:trypsin-like [Hermetia illucens]|uniref:trypsin-like n=1 Tax=Hermetia illucens TaxID=343691 RepID=UPI0018CC1582|nr:trypsin-like [Hermetia illucens]
MNNFNSKIFKSILLFFSILASARGRVVPKIVNGRKAEPGEFPSIVALRYRIFEKHFCGGTLIDTTHVVTAAHCFQLIPILPVHAMLIEVIASDLRMDQHNTSPARQAISLKKISIHPNYDTKTFKNDLAVLTLSKPITPSKLVKEIKQAKESPKVGERCITAGWGAIKEGGPLSIDLLATEIIVYEKEKCAIRAPNSTEAVVPDETQICAGDLTGRNDSCQGDSGGPLYCKNMLSGIVSYGRGCARPDSAGVYTDVSKQKDWIIKLAADGDKQDLLSKVFSFIQGLLFSNGCHLRFPTALIATMSNVYLTTLRL